LKESEEATKSNLAKSIKKQENLVVQSEEARGTLAAASTKIGNLSAELRDTRASLEEANEACESLQEELEDARAAFDELNTPRRISTKLRDSLACLEEANETCESLEEELEDARTVLDEANTARRSLSEKLRKSRKALAKQTRSARTSKQNSETHEMLWWRPSTRRATRTRKLFRRMSPNPSRLLPPNPLFKKNRRRSPLFLPLLVLRTSPPSPSTWPKDGL
jgi:chromosome segregation ATPase